MPITTEDTLQCLQQLALMLQENRDYLTQLDSAVGDADHGINMDRGFKAVMEKLQSQREMDIGSILKQVGITLVSTVEDRSGPLYGTAFWYAGIAVTGKHELNESDYIVLMEAAVEGIKARGKAQQGEKTMLDALIPALTTAKACQATHLDIVEVTRRASQAAEEGMKATIPLVATKGRARHLRERSTGHQDPGATSSWLILKTLADICATRSNKT